MRTVYRVTLFGGETFRMSADLVEASAGISASWFEDDEIDAWQATPYQTADARHDRTAAAQMVTAYFDTSPGPTPSVRSVRVIGAEA